jgi:hypothetical protein
MDSLQIIHSDMPQSHRTTYVWPHTMAHKDTMQSVVGHSLLTSKGNLPCHCEGSATMLTERGQLCCNPCVYFWLPNDEAPTPLPLSG